MRRSEGHDPLYCDCAVCCDAHDEHLLAHEQQQRFEAFQNVLEQHGGRVFRVERYAAEPRDDH